MLNQSINSVLRNDSVYALVMNTKL